MRRLLTPIRTVILFALAPGPNCAAGPINDTGIAVCGDAASNNVNCSLVDPAGHPRQDGRFGRTAMDAAGVLYKVGASDSPGFDFTKIANDGSALPAAAILGGAPGEWACTRDNVTGLVWEVKVDDPSHPRHRDHAYRWYDTDAARNGGDSGDGGDTATCGATLGLDTCNTQNYVAAVNTVALCGYTDWRMPARDELRTLVDQGKQLSGSATIDSVYFPQAQMFPYWTGTSVADGSGNAWDVSFFHGGVGFGAKSNANTVRLVRGG